MSGPRLFLDIQTIQSLRDADRGIPRFATELSRSLLAAGAPVAALGLNPLVPWPERIAPELARAPELTWNTAAAFRRVLADGPVVYVVISPFELSRPAHGVLAAHVVGVPRVAIVHDVIPHLFRDLFALDDQHSDFARVYAQRVETIRRFDLVLTPSESTRRDVVEHWGVPPERIAVIGEAASPFFVPAGPRDHPEHLLRRELPSITRPFVLCVSGREPHKNVESLIDAWARLGRPLRDAYQLVITCRLTDDDRRAWSRRAEELGIDAGELVITGYVDDAVLRALYRSASLFVLPSLYEGFGLPVLEAVSCGCPAISSNRSSLPEVLDWPAATFPPTDTEAIARLIDRALTDAEYRAELELRCRRAVERHTWPAVVDRVLGASARFSGPPPRRPRRPRVALVGPLPPARSWSAGYNARLAEHLAIACDLDCFAEPLDAGRLGPRGRTYRVFPAAAFGPTLSPAAYDLVLYTVGPDRDITYRLARTYPGVVWLRDLAFVSRELLGSALGVVVDPPAARVLLESDVDFGAIPTWEMPAALEDAARQVVAIAGRDLEPARPQQALPVSSGA